VQVGLQSGSIVYSYTKRSVKVLVLSLNYYARKQLLLSARLSHRNSVRLSVCPSVCHTSGSVKNGAS